MGKRRIKELFCLLVFLTVGGTGIKAAAAESFEIEQIQACMPELTAYVRSDVQLEADDLEIWLEEEMLETVSVTEFALAGEPTDYFVLVDVSNSIPDAYCEAVKNALTDFSDGLRDGDKMILLSFGEEVITLLEGGESQEQRAEAIAELHNQDKKTLLFEAIFQTADMADRLQDSARKIVLVISDGENFAAGASTGQEAEDALSVRNMPVYAMGISDTDKENLNKFGETARTLGGTLRVFTADETAAALQELQEKWAHTWVLELRAGSNKVNNRLNTLSVKQLSTGITRSRQVMLNNYIADTVAPEILTVEKTGDRQLTVTFSEKVVGAELGTAWSVFREEEAVGVITAAYADGDRTRVTLTFPSELYIGYYRVEASGVTDDSMEKNFVDGAWEGQLDGTEPPVEEEPAQKGWVESYWWILLLAVLLALLLAVLLIWKKIKKNRGIVYVEGKASLISNVEERQHIAISRREGLPITLELVGAEGGEKISARVCGSLIVGRASICDLSLEDAGMSRQHFALEERDGGLYITDLQTTNGTQVNGVPIRGAHRLYPRDVITAGNLQMRINW